MTNLDKFLITATSGFFVIDLSESTKIDIFKNVDYGRLDKHERKVWSIVNDELNNEYQI